MRLSSFLFGPIVGGAEGRGSSAEIRFNQVPIYIIVYSCFYPVDYRMISFFVI